MNKIEYVVIRIDGDYAYLQQMDNADGEEKCVARALLPEVIREGSKVIYEMFTYTMAE